MQKKYPEIFCDSLTDDDSDILVTESGHAIGSDNIICAGSEKAWEATKALLKEICDMFPDAPYINIDVDEANIKIWNDCMVCRKYMKENGIADEKDLYSEYVGRVASYIFELGKTPLVWEGFPKEGNHRIPKDTIVISWENHYQTTEELLDAGFKIINASWQPLYVVPSLSQRWSPFDILNWNVYNWQHWWQASSATFNPVNVTPTQQVMGAMLCAWEQSYEQEIALVMENLLDMSEKVWNVKRVCDNALFDKKLRKVLSLADKVIRDR